LILFAQHKHYVKFTPELVYLLKTTMHLFVILT